VWDNLIKTMKMGSK